MLEENNFNSICCLFFRLIPLYAKFKIFSREDNTNKYTVV